jgi:flavin-dependent dehydrogenase
VDPVLGGSDERGVVLHQRAFKARSGSLEALFEEMVAASPTVSGGLAGATRVTAVHPVANFSYRTEPAVGDRFVAIGDAVVFVDPVFSTGVYVAMQSAELASEVIVRAFRAGDFRAGRFDAYRRRVDAGTALFFEFIERYYDPAFLDVFFAPRPPATLKDALTTVFAGGGVPRATTLASRSARGRAPGRPARPLAPAAARPASGIAAVVVTGRVTAPRSPSRRSRSSRQRA